MKKTFITTMPDHVGAFLEASRRMAGLGLNLTRVSYNKAIDTHTLFIEAEGDETAIRLATEALAEIGYLPRGNSGDVLLLEFTLPDVPGAIIGILELIAQYHFNLSYLNANTQEDLGGTQQFKMGLFVEDREQFAQFLNAAARLCPVRVLDYDKTETILDNSIFYVSFASELARRMGLDERSRSELVIQSNLVMQLLEARSEPFHRTFEAIRGFGEALASHRGEAFQPRVTEYYYGPELSLTLIEPPCGSNICILKHRGMYLFIDTGYACYREETLAIFRELIPDFDTCRKAALITHAGVDHCGLLDLFPTVYMSRRSRDCLAACPIDGGDCREQNQLQSPYIRICKTLTSYQCPDPNTMLVIGSEQPLSSPLVSVGLWQFGDLEFELYEGQGGHLPGELVLVDRVHRLVFPGDILINIKELLPAQAEHNRFAPYLMNGVDTNAPLCADERKALPGVLGEGSWSLFSGHGPRLVLEV